MSLPRFGAACFGFVIGWVTYRTLRRKEGVVALSDIATVIGAVGGASVTALFRNEEIFGGYCVGLAIGFVGYMIVGLLIGGTKDFKDWMGQP